ncbi:DUF1499 domain-containing protein [Thalassospira sp.]|uniref:DUF1499 domain-containing protein n=1 Tax=Thalassospira sp. TaxID=1912094 RepID=UPI00273233D7|nr:DUF1499 domain-containing protein [Thalassospira sp.]MDP2698495.1 DUF1499 domain-containing protein [Thalassospira sp.]
MKRTLIVVFWLLCVAGLTFAVVRFSGLLETMFTSGEPDAVVFSADMQLPDDPTFFLVCAGDLCPPDADRQMTSPVFNIAATQLLSRVEEVALNSKAVIVERNPRTLEMRLLIRTPVMRFPDWIDIRIVPLDEDHSQILAFSRSVYGSGDFGANEKRLKKWLTALRDIVGEGRNTTG